MTWSPVVPPDFRGEVGKIRWEALPWLRGNGLDLGCGPWKVAPHAIGIDQVDNKGGSAANLAGDITDLIIGDETVDFVFSSHCLEDIEDHTAALAEWWRVLKVGGHLVLYLPHADLYPRIGEPGANPAHKHDFLPEDIVEAMKVAAPDWALRENQVRAERDEYSFFQVYTKRPAGSGQGALLEQSDPAKRCIVLRFGGFGDALIAASVLPHLKGEGWHISFVTGAKGEEVLRFDPYIDRIARYDIETWTAGTLRSLYDYLRRRCAKFVNFSNTAEQLLLADPRSPNFWWPHAMRQHYMNTSYLEAAHRAADAPLEYRQRFYETDAERIWAADWRRDKPRLVVLAAAGSGVNKFWPGVFEYVWRLPLRHEDLHIAVVGDLQGGHFVPHPRVHVLGQGVAMRKACALAMQADLVIGQETGLLNAVATAKMPKIVLLSHSSPANLTDAWVNAHPLTGDVPCYPCHRLHADWSGCSKDPDTQLAACQAAIEPMPAIELTERLLGVRVPA